MTVNELIKILKDYPEEERNFEILISSDEEGNAFKEIHEVILDCDEDDINADPVFIIYPIG